jgi:hypothetical protein
MKIEWKDTKGLDWRRWLYLFALWLLVPGGTLIVLLGSVVNFTIFLQKWPKIRHSSPKCCSSRSIFTNVASALQGF